MLNDALIEGKNNFCMLPVFQAIREWVWKKANLGNFLRSHVVYDFNLSIMSEPIKVLVLQDELCMKSGPLKDN